MLKPGDMYGEGDEALEFYAKHTAQIEVRLIQHKLLDFHRLLPNLFCLYFK